MDGILYEIEEYPIGFCWAETKPQHRHLLGAELEASGSLWAWNKGKHWFEGSSVTVITDHVPAAGFLTSSTQQEYGDIIASVRALMMPYIHLLRFVYTPGSEHTNADSLSRLATEREPSD